MYIVGDEIVDLIDAKQCLVSRNITHNLNAIKWMYREEPIGEFDSGWRIFGEEDTEEFLNEEGNVIPLDFNILANLNPRVVEVYNAPVGADFEIINNMFIDIDGSHIGIKYLEPFKAGTVIRIDGEQFTLKSFNHGHYQLDNGAEIRHPDITEIISEADNGIFG